MHNEIEAILKANLGKNDSVAHGFGHLMRVAEGSFWFVTRMDGTLHDAELAFVAGLFHDIVRPKTDEVWHSQDAAEMARRLLSGHYPDNDLNKICRAVEDHCLPMEKWDSVLHEAPFFADKVLEGSGAYAGFREFVWAGESPDYEVEDVVGKMVLTLRERMKGRNSPKNYPERFSRMVEYQNKWVLDFCDELEKKERDIMLFMDLFTKRAKQGVEMEKIFEEASLQKTGPVGKKFLNEAIAYMRGSKQSFFESLIQL